MIPTIYHVGLILVPREIWKTNKVIANGEENDGGGFEWEFNIKLKKQKIEHCRGKTALCNFSVKVFVIWSHFCSGMCVIAFHSNEHGWIGFFQNL